MGIMLRQRRCFISDISRLQPLYLQAARLQMQSILLRVHVADNHLLL
jgi:hypothetical protein